MAKYREKRISPEVKRLIAQRAIQLDTQRTKLAEEIQKEITDIFPDVIPPAVETIEKIISYTRKHERGTLDSPWHIGLMSRNNQDEFQNKFQVTPESLPYVLQVQHGLEDIKEKQKTDFPFFPLTIRQAEWISRLYPAVTAKKWKYSPSMVLYWWGDTYASYERVCELSKTIFDTTLLDEKLSRGELPFEIDRDEVELGDGTMSYAIRRTLKLSEKEDG